MLGPVAFEGGDTGADRSLWLAFLLPNPPNETGKETNAPLFTIAAQKSESGQIDVLNVFDDSATSAKTGTLSSVRLTGLGLAGALTFAEVAFGEATTFGAASASPPPGSAQVERSPTTARRRGSRS